MNRTFKREGYDWNVEIHEVKGRTYSKQANVKRNDEGWCVVQLNNDGRLKTLSLLPYKKIPNSVMDEIRRDLGVL